MLDMTLILSSKNDKEKIRIKDLVNIFYLALPMNFESLAIVDFNSFKSYVFHLNFLKKLFSSFFTNIFQMFQAFILMPS